MTKKKPTARGRAPSLRVWGYVTDRDDMALTCNEETVREWREMLHDHGEEGPFEFVLTPSARDWFGAKKEIESLRNNAQARAVRHGTGGERWQLTRTPSGRCFAT